MIQQYAALLEVDRGIARLFDTLQKRGLLDNTAVFLTNDNGAMYGEHYLLGKQKPYEATASLPLLSDTQNGLTPPPPLATIS